MTVFYELATCMLRPIFYELLCISIFSVFFLQCSVHDVCIQFIFSGCYSCCFQCTHHFFYKSHPRLLTYNLLIMFFTALRFIQ